MLHKLGLRKDLVNLKNVKKVLYSVPPIPRQATIEITNICNLNCAMCPRKLFKRPENHFDFELYQKVVDRLRGVEEIALIGYGETLLHPQILEAIKYGKERGFIVSMVSNGYPLANKDTFETVLCSGLDLVRFSIDSVDVEESFGHKANLTILSLIEKLREERDKRNLQLKIIVNPVVSKWNYNKIPPLINWAEKAGLDGVDLAHFNQIAGKEGVVDLNQEIDLYRSIANSKFKIKITSLYDRYFGLRKMGFRFMTKCPMSYDVVYIRQDGGVSPCSCGLPNVVYGNIFEEPLGKIWNNKKFKMFRKKQSKICVACTLFKLK